jgi:hypothetical protein
VVLASSLALFPLELSVIQLDLFRLRDLVDD